MERLECRVEGRVQMVMYRDFAERKARALGLTGKVKNERDGSVCVIAEGKKEHLEDLLVQLRKGSPLSRVENVEAKWMKATGEYADFKIDYGR